MSAIIRQSSRTVFSGLEKGEVRIIKILGEKGFLNQVELDEQLQKKNYTEDTFGRDGIKKRLYGSQQFLGLINTNFAIPFEVDKRETKIGLTLKGILAAMGHVDFKKLQQIRQLEKFLLQESRDRKVTNWSLEFIKAEVALILYYNARCGINWYNFLFTETYWDEFKQYDQNIVSRYFVNTIFEQDKTYEQIIDDFLAYFRVLDRTTEPITCCFNNMHTEHPIEFKGTIRKYVDRWYYLVPMYEIKKKDLHTEFRNYDEMEQGLSIEQLEPIWNRSEENAERILNQN